MMYFIKPCFFFSLLIKKHLYTFFAQVMRRKYVCRYSFGLNCLKKCDRRSDVCRAGRDRGVGRLPIWVPRYWVSKGPPPRRWWGGASGWGFLLGGEDQPMELEELDFLLKSIKSSDWDIMHGIW